MCWRLSWRGGLPLRSCFCSYSQWASTPLALAQVCNFRPWLYRNVISLELVLLEYAADPYATGTLAAAFQSFAYRGFTPAGGIFATLTSMGMLGILMPLEVGLAAVATTVVTMIVWAYGIGR